MRGMAHETEFDVCVRVTLSEIVLSMRWLSTAGLERSDSAAMGAP